MTLDLTFNGTLNPKYSSLLNKIAVDIQGSYSELVDSVSRRHKKNIDWWVSAAASRNTFASPLFYYCCCLALLKELICRGENISEITVDSRALRVVVKAYLNEKGIGIKVALKRRTVKKCLKEVFKPFCVLTEIWARYLALSFIAKNTRSMGRPIPAEPITLIDTVIVNGHVDKDRNYPGLVNVLSDEERRTLWFVPLLFGFKLRQYMSVVKELRRAQRNFVLKEDYLKFKDYLFAWSYFFRVRKLKIEASFFQGINLSRLIEEEVRCFNGMGSASTSLLNYRFAMRLKEADVKLRLIIDWFENQNIDKGWNAGFRRYYPETLTKGYQGFIVTPHYLCMYPTEEEYKANVIPQEIMVIGKGLVRSVKKFYTCLNVTIAPAFRFQHVWQIRQCRPTPEKYTILVALPNDIDEAVHILTSVAHGEAAFNKDILFRIRPHPAMSLEVVKKRLGIDWPKGFYIVGDAFNVCIEKADLLISNTSSVCLEALAKGIPVIVVGNSNGLTHNPIPKAVTEDVWRLCFNSDEIKEAVGRFNDNSPENVMCREEICKKIREEYFEPITKEGVKKFLDLKGVMYS